jgi:hypothetical protein
MIFKQYEDGSCDIIFSLEEIDIVSKKGKINLSGEALRHFGNVLVKIVADWNIKFSENIKAMNTDNNSIIDGK